ncbi:hypothetical protein FJ425_24110 [Mesorhizobium sp. B2-7-2]|nr:hypothetical protein FJ425_24110 [Mesorhizobium sp. B2-7-2]
MAFPGSADCFFLGCCHPKFRSEQHPCHTPSAWAKTCSPANPRAFHRFMETANRSISLVLTQFPTENRVTLFLELL